MWMTNLSFQSQNCDLTLEEGLEEYRSYLRFNGKKQLIDKPNSTIIRDHDATHVVFGLDTSLEQESLLDSWVLWGCQWKFKELFAYQKLPELKELNKYLQKEVGYLKLVLIVFKLIPLTRRIRRRTKAMNKKWPFNSPDSLMNQRVCDLRKEYGIKILESEERIITEPLIWQGTINQ
jgi:hypothetical protein